MTALEYAEAGLKDAEEILEYAKARLLSCEELHRKADEDFIRAKENVAALENLVHLARIGPHVD